MVYSEIALIAFLLLVVFAGVQIKELICSVMGNYFNKNNQPIPPRTVLPATPLPEAKEKEITVEVQRRVSKRVTSNVKAKKKTTGSQKKSKTSSAKKPAAKKL